MKTWRRIAIGTLVVAIATPVIISVGQDLIYRWEATDVASSFHALHYDLSAYRGAHSNTYPASLQDTAFADYLNEGSVKFLAKHAVAYFRPETDPLNDQVIMTCTTRFSSVSLRADGIIHASKK